MLFYLAWRIVNSTTAFLYPTYATYKALCRRPADEQELERWLMYWSVIGVVVGVEYVAEWLVSWIPLYYLLKTLFLLYLALPGGQGAAFVYTTQLRPLLAQHEDQIDAAFGRLRGHAYEYAVAQLRRLTALVVNTPPPDIHAPQAAPPPTQHDPMSGPAQMVQGLWAAYGPTVVAGAAAFVRAHQPQPAAASSTAAAAPAPVAGYAVAPEPRRQASDTASVLRRRRELEAELAALPAAPPSPGSSASGGDTTRFEEVDDVSGDESPARPGAARRSSWWGWRGDGYQAVSGGKAE